MNYLYNGIELPALPFRDKETLSYAYIGHKNDIYYLFYSSIEFTVSSDNTIITGINTYKAVDGSWVDSSFNNIITVVWSDHDVYYKEDGTLYLAASEPIPITAPVIEPLSMWMGWKAGNWVARQRGKSKQPVAYLYNGVRLPGLPEWDKVKYPYAFIETTFGLYYLRVLANPLTPDGNSFRMTPPGLVASAKIDIADYELIGWNEWSEVTEITRIPLWSNFDVLNEDGTVYLAASEPVPVYE